MRSASQTPNTHHRLHAAGKPCGGLVPVSILCVPAALILVMLVAPGAMLIDREINSCEEALQRIGKAVKAYILVYEEPPEKLSVLWSRGFVKRFDHFLCPGSETLIGTAEGIDELSDFELVVSAEADKDSPLVQTKALEGRTAFAFLNNGSIVDLGGEAVVGATGNDEGDEASDADSGEEPADTDAQSSAADNDSGTNITSTLIVLLSVVVFAIAIFIALRIRSGRRIVVPGEKTDISLDLEITTPDQQSERVSFDSLPITIGRSEDNDLVLSDPTVSRSHAGIYYEKGKIRIIDLKSSNGIIVDDRRVRKAEISQHSTIRIGNTTLTIV